MDADQKVPVYRVHDKDFSVHLREAEFRQVDDATNRISFRHLRDNGNHTVIIYDPRTRNAFQGTWREFMERKDIVMVRLPSLINLDRETLKEIIRERGTMDFLSRNDRVSFFKDFDKPVNGENQSSKKKSRSI